MSGCVFLFINDIQLLIFLNDFLSFTEYIKNMPDAPLKYVFLYSWNKSKSPHVFQNYIFILLSSISIIFILKSIPKKIE